MSLLSLSCFFLVVWLLFVSSSFFTSGPKKVNKKKTGSIFYNSFSEYGLIGSEAY